MATLEEVDFPSIAPDRFRTLIGLDRMRRFLVAGEAAVELLAGRTVWNLTGEATLTGVAELLRAVLPYVRGAGVDTRWLVLGAGEEYRTVMRRVRLGLDGVDGADDDAPLDEGLRRDCEAALAPAVAELLSLIGPDDVVLLHDPDTAPLAAPLRIAGSTVVWRCHGGADKSDAVVERAWTFLRPSLEAAHAFVFSRAAYVPPWLPPERVAVIAPSLDPFGPKNQYLDLDAVHAVLGRAGLLAAAGADPPAEYVRTDGTPALVTRPAVLLEGDEPIPAGAPVVAQTTRWDPLKDMVGVLHAFAEGVRSRRAHLLLAGPDPAARADGSARAVFDECAAAWQALPLDTRRRVHVVRLPLDDPEENAVVVNAIQRHADVVVQKSLYDSFSTAVAEAMLKGRAIVASAVGGMREQITDGTTGLLLQDPRDHAEFGAAVDRLVTDPRLADRLRIEAYARAKENFLLDRHLTRYVALFSRLLDQVD